MLHILLKLGNEPYALPARQVVRIVPMLQLKTLPQAPACVAGLLDYRGAVTPVIDLCALALGRPSSPRLSTRILLVSYPITRHDQRLLGLLAEDVTETVELDVKKAAPSGVTVADAPYLGKVATTEYGMVQLIEVEQLLPSSLRQSLFQPEALHT